jgi:hypothetical protein
LRVRIHARMLADLTFKCTVTSDPLKQLIGDSGV